MNALAVVGSIFVIIASTIHLMIFVMESVLWSRPAVWKRFGLRTQADADVTQPMAFNQGFYNLFLGVGAALGVILLAQPTFGEAGAAIAIFAAASMVLAATVLVVSSPKLARAAAIQGGAPLIGAALLALSLTVGWR